MVSMPVAVRAVQSFELDWNAQSSTNAQFTLPPSLSNYAWRCTSVAITVAATSPVNFVIRLYGGVTNGTTAGAVEVTARSRTLMATTAPQQIVFRNGAHVQHTDTGSGVFVAVAVTDGAEAITVAGVVRLSVLGSF